MTLFQDFLSLLSGCIGLHYNNDRFSFMITLAVGVMLAVGCWVGCSHYSHLWNRRYQVTLIHHILCSFAALLTLGFTIIFGALRYTKEAAYASVQVWEFQVNMDRTWADSTFASAFQRVKSLGTEDFSTVPLPGMPGSLIPLNTDTSVLAAASTYASSAAQHFVEERPLLSKIIRTRADIPTQVLSADTKHYFANVSKTYPPDRAISLVSREIKRQLDEQVPRVVTVSRTVAVGSFLLVQILPFGLVGIAAYRDLKVIT